jgi:hypothetical protein
VGPGKLKIKNSKEFNMDKMVGAMDNRAVVKTVLDKYNVSKGK